MKMASEDVIELGSSDDEAEAPPKKKKPALNAMVHFPTKLPGIVIKSQKNVPSSLPKVLASGAVTITKTVRPVSVTNKVKQNNRPPPKIPQKVPQRVPKTHSVRPISKPIVIQNHLSINPLNVIKLHQAPKLSLPPGITVKRTAAGQKILPEVSIIKKKTIRAKPREKMITTVELDDEVVPVSGPSPQWYLRPEEQVNEPAMKEEEEPKDNTLEMVNSMEVENNKEPDKTNFIEITIEDSPVKPVASKRMFEVGAELAITIDDSPVKAAQDEPCASGSDSEMPSPTTPQSKKKLEYPKKEKELIPNERETQMIVEIDLENCLVTEETEQSKGYEIDQKQVDKVNEKRDIDKKSTEKRIQPVLLTKEVTKEKTNELESKSDNVEFHPVYQRFIDLCFEIENSDDMKKIVEKKIKTYYKQCPQEYVESEEFIDMVSSKIFAIKAMPDKMYLYIKDIVDELNLQRKTAKAVDQVSNKENEQKDNDKYFYNEETERGSKRARQIRKLEKTIRKLHRAIQKLEEQEVEFEDEDDSVYLLTERYKERLVRVYGKFCQMTNTKMPSEPRIQIESRPGQPTGPAKRLEKWVNRKVPIGMPLPFPDFHDVLHCVRNANEEDGLGWNEADIMEEARDLFTRCGKKLQRRRQENEWRIAASRITHDTSSVDPAEKSDCLKKKLEENKKMAAKKETEVLNKYADKQNQLKLVGEEIGDKEADESPVESEDEEVNEESSALENKQKRKERLRRLLQEKTRKMSVEKENTSKNEIIDKAEEVNDMSKDEKQEVKISTLVEKENKQDDANDEDAKVENESNAEMVNEDPSIKEIKPDNKNVKEDKKTDYDTFDVDSDIDELHLLQKLYSENEMNSSTPESDSDSPIAISDSLESESETEKAKKLQNYEVISIENSSYSESEMSQKECSNDQESKNAKNKNVEVEVSSQYKCKTAECDENILLASSDDEHENIEPQSENIETQIENISDRKTTDDIEEKLNKNVMDEVTLDDCDDNAKYIEKTTEVAEDLESNVTSTEDKDVAEDNQMVALIEQNNSNKEGTYEMDDSMSEIVSENNDLNNDTPNNITNKEHINDENKMIIDECSSQNSEGSCEIVSLSEACNKQNVENQITRTHLDNLESHNNSEVIVSLINEENLEKNGTLPMVDCLNQNHKSSSNSASVIFTENKLNECKTPEDVKIDISEEQLESSESLKDQQINVSEDIQTSVLVKENL